MVYVEMHSIMMSYPCRREPHAVAISTLTANMYAITAFIVPDAGSPCKRNESISSQFVTNLFLTFISFITLANGSFKAAPCARVATSSPGYLSKVKIAAGSSRRAKEVSACAASDNGFIRSMSALNSITASGPPCSSKTSSNSSGPILAANFFYKARSVRAFGAC